MDYPFYRNYYYPATEVAVPSPRETRPATARKVIHVPVMDGSEKPRRSRSESAVTIQKVLRGFLVRKNVKKIAEIKAEVDEMENRITSRECMELIRKDSKERLKINEMLMRLLLKLDSVRGVDSGVRDLRKAVIKKAIRLQELVDSIVDQNESDLNPNSNPISNSEAVEMQNNREFESGEGVPEAINGEDRGNAASNAPEVEDDGAKSTSELKSNSNSNTPENNVDASLESQSVPENRGDDQIQGNLAKSANESSSDLKYDVNRDLEMHNNIQSVPEAHGNEEAEEANEYAESMELSQEESQTGSSANPENAMEGDEDRGSDSDTSEKDENGGGVEKGEVKEGSERKNVQLLEKLVEENEKMMGLMADLFKKNEMQTQLLSSLSQRVEHLERALMCERFRRKKKRNGTC